ADRAGKDGAKPLASWLTKAAELEGPALREKIRELHSPERAEAFYEKIRAHVESAGSVRKAVETMDDCWDLVPLLTEAVILLIWLSWEIAILHPLLFIIMLPALIAWIVALPFALIIDYVILLPFCFLLESLGECGDEKPILGT
ncbi:MAG TPA: hypothetical protein VM598_06880, partial [Bdellovibrionota bacterium]|nr:hypothetical protein [Bdellovibrionota bacterium]